MQFKIVLRWFPLASVGIFFIAGLVFGFLHRIDSADGHQWAKQLILGQSKSQAFHFFASVALLWYAVCVAAVGRSRWPVSNVRNIFMYGPMAFAFGFAARYFVLVFGFTAPISVDQETQKLALIALLVLVYLVFLVALPTYATFRGAFVGDEPLFRKISGVVAVALLVWLLQIYVF